ncbi:ATP-binding protein [Kitasatospora sp. NPDC059599]|uniref:ATP-binding protein n=1 Tax=Kitasatospora sp. NPDC059599 TaxID=3346880 RepID=UPI0036965BD6
MAAIPTVFDLAGAGSRPALHGRERESHALRELLAAPGEGCVSVLLRGDWGIGKTALLREVLSQARRQQDVLVLSASVDPLEREAPFAMVRQLFESPGAPPGPDLPGPDLPGPDLPAAATTATMTMTRTATTATTATTAATATEAEAALLGASYRHVARLAGHGRLVLAVDDLQRADPGSLRWLRYLLCRGADLPLVVLAVLGEEGTHPNAGALADVLPLFGHRVTLGALAEEAVGALAEESLGRPAERSMAAACREATGGNPLLLRAVLRGLREAGQHDPGASLAARIAEHVPADLGPAVLARTAALAPHAAATVAAVAVLGGEPGTDLLAEVTGLTEPEVEDAVHGLVRSGCLQRTGVGTGAGTESRTGTDSEPDPGSEPEARSGVAAGPRAGVAFRFEAVAAAAASTVLPSRRMDLHARAARFLHAHGAPAERIAAHLLSGPPGEPWASRVLALAAERAGERGDQAQAAAYVRRALREDVPGKELAGLLGALGRLELASSVPVAVRSLEHSLRLCREPGERAEVARRLAGALLALDRHPDAVEVLRQAGEQIREEDPDQAMRLEIDRLHIDLTNAANAPQTVRRLLELNVLDTGDPGVRRPLAALLSLREAMVGRCPQEVVNLAELALGQGADPLSDESVVYYDALIALRAAGRTETALELADAAVDRAHARGSVLGRVQALSVRAHMAARLGRLTESHADARSALVELQGIGIGPAHSFAVFATTTAMDSLVRRGRADDAELLLTRAGLDGALSPNWVNDHVLMVRGRLRVAQGRLEEALADFLHCGKRAYARGMAGPAFHSWRSEAALVQAALRRGAGARSLAAEEVRLARLWGVPEAVGTALHGMGLVVGGPEGLELLREAVALLERSPARLRHAQALADCGILARKAGRLPEARGFLQRAASLADECGATVLGDLVLAELRAVGDRPRSRTFHGVAALTPSERRVADLAALGLTNREIAQRLFVGLRTVEVHLTNVYGKLAIDGRSGLTAALAGTGEQPAPTVVGPRPGTPRGLPRPAGV